MKAVVQRVVSGASYCSCLEFVLVFCLLLLSMADLAGSVRVEGEVVASIGRGLVALIGIHRYHRARGGSRYLQGRHAGGEGIYSEETTRTQVRGMECS